MNINGSATHDHVYVVDDDASMRDALCLVLKADGLTVTTYGAAREFLAVCTPATRGCLILDMGMPDMNGLDLQEELQRRGVSLPIIFLSGQCSIPETVRALKTGAMDFLTKPVEGALLRECVQKALLHDALRHKQEVLRQSITSGADALTVREREVMMLVVVGHSSKEIAKRLAISYRTVETHRSRVMQKTGAASILELMHISGISTTKK